MVGIQLTDTYFHVWIAVMRGDMEAKKYLATISLFGKNIFESKAAASWTVPVIPYHDCGATISGDKASLV